MHPHGPCSLGSVCYDRKFAAPWRERCARDIGIITFDAQAALLELPLYIFRAETLKPVIDGARTSRLDDRGLIKDHLFLLILEGIQKAIIFVRRPKAVEEIGFIPCLLFSFAEGREGINIEENGTGGFEERMEFAEDLPPLIGAERRKIAHDHYDEMKAIRF